MSSIQTATVEPAHHPCVSSSLDLFDADLGGFPAGECTLVCGGADTGKTPLALQFVHAGLTNGEKVALVTSFAPEEILARAASMELDLEGYLTTAQFILIEQKTQTQGIIGSEQELEQMMQALEQDLIPWEPTRVVIDSAVPLIGLFQADFRRIAIPSFIRRLNRHHYTTLLTTLMPASSEAMNVRKIIEDLSACSLHLDEQRRPDGTVVRRMTVRKMRGMEPPYPVYETELTSLNRLKLMNRFDVDLDSPSRPQQVTRPAIPVRQPAAAATTRGMTRPIFAEYGASVEKISAATRSPHTRVRVTMAQPSLGKTADSAPASEATPPQTKEKKSPGFSFKAPS